MPLFRCSILITDYVEYLVSRFGLFFLVFVYGLWNIRSFYYFHYYFIKFVSKVVVYFLVNREKTNSVCYYICLRDILVHFINVYICRMRIMHFVILICVLNYSLFFVNSAKHLSLEKNHHTHKHKRACTQI